MGVCWATHAHTLTAATSGHLTGCSACIPRNPLPTLTPPRVLASCGPHVFSSPAPPGPGKPWASRVFFTRPPRSWQAVGLTCFFHLPPRSWQAVGLTCFFQR